MSRVVPVAVPVLLGIGSVRVYAMKEEKSEMQLSPQQLSIYPAQESRLYTEEKPGSVQRGLASVRGSLQPHVQKIKNGVSSVKVTAVNLYHAGEDVYHFLKDPPSGFVPRVALISVLGLTGVILSRKGSRLKKLALPLGLGIAGLGVCYPVQSVTVLKVGGRKVYTASQWTSTSVASLWKSSTPTAVPVSSKSESSESGLEPCHSEASESSNIKPGIHEAPQSEATFTPESHDLTSEERITSPEFLVLNMEGKSFDQKRAEAQPAPPTEKIQTKSEEGEPRVIQPLMDFGQSNPEDSDLYSTRS